MFDGVVTISEAPVSTGILCDGDSGDSLGEQNKRHEDSLQVFKFMVCSPTNDNKCLTMMLMASTT